MVSKANPQLARGEEAIATHDLPHGDRVVGLLEQLVSNTGEILTLLGKERPAVSSEGVVTAILEQEFGSA